MNHYQTLTVQKAFTPVTSEPPDKAAAMAVINKLALEPVDPESIYLVRAKVANDQIDRTGERFPVGYLERFAQTLPGCPVLVEHDKKKVPVGRWYGASVARDTDGVHHLIGDFYMRADSEATKDLKLGIAREMSLGYYSAGRRCDLCGSPIDGAYGCGHQINKVYDGQRCTATYNGDLARVATFEGSLVGVGAQWGAEAIGAKSAGAVVIAIEEEGMKPEEYEERIKALAAENETLKAAAGLIEDGKLYRQDLLAEIERKAGLLEKDATLDLSLLANAGIEQIKAYDARLSGEINAKFPPTPQSKMLGAGAAPLPELGGPAPEPPSDPYFMWRDS